MNGLRKGALVALAAVALSPGLAQATHLSPTATMYATCYSNCQYVEFVLLFDGGWELAGVEITSLNTSNWAFEEVMSVTSDGSPISPTGDPNPPDANFLAIDFNALNVDAMSPIKILVKMQAGHATDEALLFNGDLVFSGDVCGVIGQQSYDCSNSFPERTAVTPEPVTMALLGTGLAGLAGVGARRRKRFPTDSE